MKRSLSRLSLALPLFLHLSCGSGADPSVSDEAWNAANNPVIMGYNKLKASYQYTNQYEKLALKAQIPVAPWPSDYWSNQKGGASYRWQPGNEAIKKLKASDASVSASALKKAAEPFYAYPVFGETDVDITLAKLSPTEKYDLLRGDSTFSLSTSERKRTEVMKTVVGADEYQADFKIASWYGLCHAWAPASFLFKPVADVQVKGPNGEGIYFSAGDVQALLTVFLDRVSPNDETQFLGGRCEESFKELMKKVQDKTLTAEEYLKAVNASNCSDTNAGSFHIVLANQIGRLAEPFVVDVTRDQEVWNQPVVAYESREVGESAPNANAARGTAKMVKVKTAMYYVKAINPNITGKPAYAYDIGLYTYYLELDAKGAIIGGQWIDKANPVVNSGLASAQSKDRPDFMWKRTLPAFTGTYAALKPLYESAQTVYVKRKYKTFDPIKDMPASKKAKLEAFWK